MSASGGEESDDEPLDYKQHAEDLKDQGNKAFQAGDVQSAIRLFTQAIDIDPDNHVYYSNRSAAYMKADSKSKALRDAEKCVELAPTWPKGYSRLGAAQQSLKRFDAAIDTFKKGWLKVTVLYRIMSSILSLPIVATVVCPIITLWSL